MYVCFLSVAMSIEIFAAWEGMIALGKFWEMAVVRAIHGSSQGYTCSSQCLGISPGKSWGNIKCLE